MLMENQSAAAAGFSVSYESAPQFSREYKRLFGHPPMQVTDLLKNI
jgi:AraC-like DNA-binding protein